jgi:t-SNARE complex subunit (syntaxin)
MLGRAHSTGKGVNVYDIQGQLDASVWSMRKGRVKECVCGGICIIIILIIVNIY